MDRATHLPAHLPDFHGHRDDTLYAAGLTGRSLVDGDGQIWLPYDVARETDPLPGLRPLSRLRFTHCLAQQAFEQDWENQTEVHVLNGSGVALGDTIVAFSVLFALKARIPDLHWVIYQAKHVPAPVRRLGELAAPYLGELKFLPAPLASIPDQATLIDLGDFAYWPEFAQLPLCEFFAHALGACPATLPKHAYQNTWLQKLTLAPPPAPWDEQPYVLFAPQSSSPLREISGEICLRLLDYIADVYKLPVVGCAPIRHPGYHCISGASADIVAFLNGVRHARILVTTDSAALHAAAGFGIPTLAGFVCIDPARRTTHYPLCRALDLRRPELNGLHHSDAPALIGLAQTAWREALQGNIPWPALLA